MELETHCIVAHGLGFINQSNLDQTSERVEEIGRMLNGLIQALRTPREPEPDAAVGAPNS